MRSEDIKRLLEAILPCDYIEVKGEDGAHFEALIVSANFENKPLIQQHKIVYAALGEHMKANIHAFSMRTLTPAQWQQDK